MSTLQSLQRFDEYYLTGGDLYCIAENRIFRVHRYFFERESQYFRAQLAQPVTPGAQRLGTGEDNAILLDGVRSQAFAKLLFIFYNPRYSIYELVVDDWATILELADKWGFAEVKNLCVRQLEALEMLDVDRIVLYHDNHVDERLLVPRYVALCDRPELLTVDEGLRLGMATVIALTRARECARNGASSGLRSPSPPSMTEKEMREIVLDHFHIDMKSDSDPLKTEGAYTHNLPPLRALTAEPQASPPTPLLPPPPPQDPSPMATATASPQSHPNPKVPPVPPSPPGPPSRPTISVSSLARSWSLTGSPIAVPPPGTRHLEEIRLAQAQTPNLTPVQTPLPPTAPGTPKRTRRLERSRRSNEDAEDSGYGTETVKGAAERLARNEDELMNSYEQEQVKKLDADAIDEPQARTNGKAIGVEPRAPPIPSPRKPIRMHLPRSYTPSDSEADEFFDSAEDPNIEWESWA